MGQEIYFNHQLLGTDVAIRKSGPFLQARQVGLALLIKYDMDLQLRPGARHQLPDALPRFPCSESIDEDNNEAFPDDTSSRQAYRGPGGPALDDVPLTELGADQVDRPITRSVVALAGVSTIPQDVAGSIEGVAQILLRPSPPNTSTEETGSGRGDDDSLEGLASLEEVGGVTRAVSSALSRATSQPPSLSMPQPPFQQPQPMEQDPTLCRKEGATEVKEPITTHPPILAETADIQQNSRFLEQKQRRDAVLELILAKIGAEKIGEYVLDDDRLLLYKGEDPKLAIPRVMVPGILALVRSTFGHPGVARTALLVQNKYHWPMLVKGVREYVLSCGCRRKRARNSEEP